MLYLLVLFTLAMAMPNTGNAFYWTHCGTAFKSFRELSIKRKLSEIDELRIASYNLLNLDSHTGIWLKNGYERYFDYEPGESKPAHEVAGVARAINKTNSDILVVQEVRGKDLADARKALSQLNEEHLHGAYDIHITEGNSSRGIYIAYLTKKDLPFHYELRSHRNKTWVDPVRNPDGAESKVFSRDFPALLIRTSPEDDPKLIMFGTHFKSKRSRSEDQNSRILAKGQATAAAQVISNIENEFPNAHITVSGDFNASLAENSMKPIIAQTKLRNPLDHDADYEAPFDRYSHFYFRQNGKPDHKEIDYNLINPGLLPYLKDAGILAYTSPDGTTVPIPENFEMRKKLQPSDHRPAYLILDAQFLK